MPAFTTNQFPNVPGTVTRTSHLRMEPQTLLASGNPLYYGLPVVVDPASGSITGVGPATTPDLISGIIIRPTVTSTASPLGALLVAPLQTLLTQVDVLRQGYVAVKLQGAAIPQRNGLVYVRIANPPAGSIVGGFEAASDGANTIALGGDTYFFGTPDNSGSIEIFFMALRNQAAGGSGGGVTSLLVGASGTPRTGAIRFLAGTNQTITDNNDQSFTWTGGSGGGGGFSAVTARWTIANNANKDAYSSAGIVNNDGITIALTASSNPGTLAPFTITLNGTALGTTFTPQGAFPNYLIVITAATLIGNAIEVANVITVALQSSQFNLTANNLTNNQPIPFALTYNARFLASAYPFYISTDRVLLTGSVVGNQTALATSVSDGTTSESPINLNETTTNSFRFLTTTYGGSVTGTGTRGAGSLTIPVNQTLTAPALFVPAFLAQTPDSAIPIFTTATSQTVAAAAGSTVTYSPAPATSYNWVATQRPLANLMLQSPFGNSVLVPDVTGPNQTISGQVFAVYGWTRLSLNATSVLVIS